MVQHGSGILVVIGLGLASCGGSHSPASPVPGPAVQDALAEVDVAALKTARDGGSPPLIDVRTPAEFADGHVPGAVNIPLDALAGRLGELESHKQATVYLICRSGARSARAQSVLAEAGFAQPVNVAGGTLAWKAAGYPVE